MNGTHAAKSRRNLTHTNDRTMWEEARKEDHPLRYRLHLQDCAYNFKGDKITLLAEIKESKPIRIERLPAFEVRFASLPEHLHALNNIEFVEVP